MTVIDPNTLERMYRYAGRDLFEPREVEVDVWSLWSRETWPLSEFCSVVADLLKKVPAECLGSAKVEFETGRYDEGGHLAVTYWRTETAEEISRRVADAYNYAQRQEGAERAAYEELKAKYGP